MLFGILAALSLIPQPTRIIEHSGFMAAGEIRAATDLKIPAEGYRLTIDSNGVSIVSADAAGRFYAEQTLAQLEVDVGGEKVYPFVEIEDAPQYGWRGIHIDECRHFFGPETLKKTIDQMAKYKFNVLHWHITEDQAWRIEIPGYPDLLTYGAVRSSSPRHRAMKEQDNLRYGPFFYTTKQVEEIVSYASARYVRIVPEIEMPGHFQAALAAYPQFACRPENLASRNPMTKWGISEEVLCVGNDEALRFLEVVLDHVCRMFPGEYVHIGGDECPSARWKECPKCRARMAAEGMKDVKELQPWLTRRIVKFLAERGKRTIGWDEYISADTPKSAAGMVWRTDAVDGVGDHEVHSLASLAADGHDVVNCQVPMTYFYFGQGLLNDPFEYGQGGVLPIAKVYSFNPSAGVAEKDRCHVLGGQCCNWAEYTWNEYDLEWKIWPRALAMAEVLWSGDRRPGYADFRRRAEDHRTKLIQAGVNCATFE